MPAFAVSFVICLPTACAPCRRSRWVKIAFVMSYPIAASTEGPATSIAIKLGHDNAVKVYALGESADNIDNILASHGVDNHKNLIWLDGALDSNGLFHHFFVNLKTASGIDNYQVVEVINSLLDCLRRNSNSVFAIAAIDCYANL